MDWFTIFANLVSFYLLYVFIQDSVVTIDAEVTFISLILFYLCIPNLYCFIDSVNTVEIFWRPVFK